MSIIKKIKIQIYIWDFFIKWTLLIIKEIMNYLLQTFGCQMNYADSEKINMILLQSWLTKVISNETADIIIFNTCSVRKKWEDKVFSFINEIKKINKSGWKKIIVAVTWCMVRKTWINKKYYESDRKRVATKNIEILNKDDDIYNSDDKIFGRNDNIDFVFRIENVWYITKILSLIFKKEIWNDEKYNDYLRIKQLQDNPGSANIIIQTWCDNFCTYCIVPFTRGREKSRNKEEILEEIRSVVNKWTKEVTLIWQNVNSYWKEIQNKLWNNEEAKWVISNNNWNFITPFRELLNEIDNIEWLNRIRFTSSNPHDMTLDILDSHFELNKTCNYLHFALQSWDDEILKKMNRKHTYNDFKTQVEYLRNKDPLFAISTDIIVWFPWETEENFWNTVKSMIELEFDFAYIARYSERFWTSASKNLKDNIPYSIKAKRWHILNDLLEKSVKKRSELLIWKTEEILISGIWKSNKFYGRTRNFKEVFFNQKPWVKIGDIVKVKINKLNSWILDWEII